MFLSGFAPPRPKLPPPPAGVAPGSRSTQCIQGARRFPPWKLIPPSHTYRTRTDLPPNGQLDKNHQGQNHIWGLGSPPARPQSRVPAGEATGTHRSPELILSLDVKETKNGEKQKEKSYMDPSPTSQPRARKQSAATKPKQRSKGRRKVAHSLVGLCLVRVPVAGMEVQASKWGRGVRCS